MENIVKSKAFWVVVFAAVGILVVASIIVDKSISRKEVFVSTEIEAGIAEADTEEETEEETTVETVDEPSIYHPSYLYEQVSMYATTNLNVRKGAGLEYDIYKTVPVNTELTVIYYDTNHLWEVVLIDDQYYFVASEYLSFEQVEIIVEEPIKYYGVWSGAYWHFTPEEIDNQWNGMKRGKAALTQGTTRAWQKYLYEKLKERGFEWFYIYAVAQALQESGMNPLNNQDHSIISWLNGEATYDCGLYSFKTKYWNQSYGDVFDYHANINAYIDRVSPYLAGGVDNLNRAIAQHYDPYAYHQEYVNAVLGRVNELWEVE